MYKSTKGRAGPGWVMSFLNPTLKIAGFSKLGRTLPSSFWISKKPPLLQVGSGRTPSLEGQIDGPLNKSKHMMTQWVAMKLVIHQDVISSPSPIFNDIYQSQEKMDT